MTPFLKEVAQDLYHRFGDDIQHCHIIFNNKRPAAYLKKMLAESFGRAYFSPRFYTVQAFMAQLSGQKVADFYIEFFHLLRAYNLLLQQEGKSRINSAHFLPLAKTILSDFAQIDSDLVDADKLYRDMGDIAQIDQEFDYLTQEQHEFLSRFWESYSATKHKERKERFIALWRRMPGLYHQFHASLQAQGYSTYGRIYRHLAQSDLEGLDFLQNLGAGKLIFVGFNALSRAEANIFKTLQSQGKALFYFDTDPYYLDDKQQEAGYFLRRNFEEYGLLNALTSTKHFFEDFPRQLSLYAVQGQSVQAKLLPQLLGKDYGHSAVVLADESLLIPCLQSIDEQVPLNITMGYALSQSSLYSWIDLWLQIQAELLKQQRLDHQQIEAFLSHPHTVIATATKTRIRQEIIDENLVNLSLDRLQAEAEPLMQLYFRVADRGVNLLNNLLELLRTLWQQHSEQQGLNKIEARILLQCLKELTRMQDTLGAYLQDEDHDLVGQLLRKILLGISVPFEEQEQDALQLMGLLESRNLNFDHVLILGFNEGIIPKTSLADSFIPDSIRRAYGLPIAENLDAVSAYMFYRLVQRASKVTLLYNSLPELGGGGEPSRFYYQLQYESKFTIEHKQLVLPLVAERTETFSLAKDQEPIKSALQRYLKGERYLSPTALNTYIANPIDFAYKYLLDIKEPKEVNDNLEARFIGEVLHKVLEEAYADKIGKLVDEEYINKIKSELPLRVQQAFEKIAELNLEQHQLLPAQKLALAIVQKFADKALSIDATYVPFTIKALEHDFESKFHFVLKGKTESVTFKGIIDRIDEKEGLVRIVDYKTGGDKNRFNGVNKLFDTNDKQQNKAVLQTLLYTSLYADQHQIAQIAPHLYLLKEKNEGTEIRHGKTILDAEEMQAIKTDFINALADKLAELFDENIAFEKSTVPDNYKYSIYKTLFGEID